MSSKSVLVVGASRGIGLELVKQLARDPNTTVYAASRKIPATPWFSNNNIKYIQLDQTSPESVEAAATQVPELDTIILNAAIGENDHFVDVTPQRFTEYLDANVVGPLRVVQAFRPALEKRKTRKIMFISSTAGSLQVQTGSNWGLQGPYAVTKAAGNMLVVQLNNELRSQGYSITSVHPGWVDTDMGRSGGSTGGMPIPKSAAYLLEVEDDMTVEFGGKFLNYDGHVLPW
jgi:NAD(P)-dependent dehydrogenase (short-subunit alcohol dehydrogenase family)